MQRIFNCDKIQNTGLTPDKVCSECFDVWIAQLDEIRYAEEQVKRP